MRIRFLYRRAVRLLVAAGLFMPGLAVAATLDDVKARGTLVCGVNEGLLGFAMQDSAGEWAGFDADFCRAVAAAIFNDAEKVAFMPMSLDDRFTALRDGKIDMLSRNSTWTMGRETEFDLTFAGVTYYDGQGFMLPRSAGILSALELDGRKICVLASTTTEANLADYFGANNMTYEAIVTTSAAASLAAYKAGTCEVMTSDMSQLYAARVQLDDSAEHVILADAISKEPLGPAVREADPEWATLVKWVHYALINAEELGVFSYNIEQALASKKPEVRRLVGLEGDFGERLGLGNDWVVRMVGAVGNYGEIFARNLGFDSDLHIPRGMNQLWHLGGIQYAPPIR
jgi:general L-amino acid transport system substrate-binding protein